MPGVHVPAYVGLGSNLEDPVQQVRAGLEALARIPRTRLVARSHLYLNPPMGPPGQPDFVNAVAGLLTCLSAEALLGEMQAIEDAQGRRRDGARWGPRILDLDLLLFGSVCMDGERLTLPHPGLPERAFVLTPLREIAPALRTPDGSSVARMATALGDAGLQRLQD